MVPLPLIRPAPTTTTSANRLTGAPRQRQQSCGYDLRGLRGRQVSAQDFQLFDYVLAMDRTNLAALERLCPPQQTHKIGLFMGFGRSSAAAEVPDPYYGGADGFERMLDMIEDAGGGLLQEIVRRNAELSA